MSVGVRCFQCKEKLKGRGTGQKHKEATGHSWQPGYYCTDCRQTFSSYGECRRHTRQPGVHSNAGPTRSYAISTTSSSSSSSASDRPPRLGGLVPVGVAPSTDDASSSSESEMESEDEKFPRCTACRPPIVFSSRGSLEQHLARTYTCTKCSIHLYTAESLQDHYRSSSAHPNCRECGNGFPALAEWATHRARCPPPVPSAAESTRSTSAPRSISDRSSFAPASARDSDVASHDGTALESEVSSLAPGSPPLNPTVVAMSHDTPGDSAMSNEISTSNAIDQTPLTENEVSDAGVLPDGIAPLKVDKGKGNARASDGIATPAAATAIPEGDAQRTTTSSLSFHCRSCLADPCVEPVATLCGHVFCHSCIVRELAAKMCCPVCQRPFLVRLHVGVGS